MRYEPDGHSCGAILLDRLHVLTAAHCFIHPVVASPSAWTVHLGRNNKIMRDFATEVVRYVDEIIEHPNWTANTANENPRMRYDIAVLRLNAPVPVDNVFVKPVCLPDASQDVDDSYTAYVSGWGDVLGEIRRLRLSLAFVLRAPNT